jgi:hypothetical protein
LCVAYLLSRAQIRRDAPVKTMSDTDMAAVVAQIVAEAEEAKKATSASAMET